MTEAQCLQLLKLIRTLALLPYPWPEGSKPVADMVIYALGEIAGIAGKTLALMEGIGEC